MRNIFEVSPDGYVIGRTATGKCFIFDPEDFPIVAKHTWGIHRDGYVTAKSNGKNIRLHRLILKPMDGFQVDHINGNPADNRKSNLRECTQPQNNMNVPKNLNIKTSTRYKGVSLIGNGRYRASIGFNGKKFHIGYYKTAEEAALAYNRKANELFGEFARMNRIPCDENCEKEASG